MAFLLHVALASGLTFSLIVRVLDVHAWVQITIEATFVYVTHRK